MLGDDALVLVRTVVYLREVPEHITYVAVENDGAGIERSEQLFVDDLFAVQTTRLFELLGILGQLFPNPVARDLEEIAQKLAVLGGDLKGYGIAHPRRVLISHKEHSLLVVRPPVGVSAPPGAAF